MKLFFVLFTIASSTALASENGSWEISGRSCYGGVTPSDSFVIGRDKRIFTFDEGLRTFTYRLTIGDKWLSSEGTYFVNESNPDVPSFCFDVQKVESNEKDWQSNYAKAGHFCLSVYMSADTMQFLEYQAFEAPFSDSCPDRQFLMSSYKRSAGLLLPHHAFP